MVVGADEADIVGQPGAELALRLGSAHADNLQPVVGSGTCVSGHAFLCMYISNYMCLLNSGSISTPSC